jgi:putative restriction endonuclease
MSRNTLKYLTWDLLVEINESSIKAGRNRTFHIERLPVKRSDLFPVAFWFPHNDKEIRTEIILNEKGTTGWLDMSMDEFTRLPLEDD